MIFFVCKQIIEQLLTILIAVFNLMSYLQWRLLKGVGRACAPQMRRCLPKTDRCVESSHAE